TSSQPGLVLIVISFLSELQMHTFMPPFSEGEVHLLLPGKVERAMSTIVELLSFFQLSVQESNADGHCLREECATVDGQWLTMIFYGAYLTAHMCKQDVLATYELHLAFIFKGKE